jgi:hypothetical protein
MLGPSTHLFRGKQTPRTIDRLAIPFPFHSCLSVSAEQSPAETNPVELVRTDQLSPESSAAKADALVMVMHW